MADTPSKRTKRRVKNPETFRERVLKASEGSDSQTRTKLKSGASKLATPVKPIGKAAQRLSSAKLFRLLAKPLRLIGRIIFPVYFRQSWRELKLVAWPSWRESRRLTYAVLIFAIIFGALIALVDYGLDKVFRNVLLK